LEPAQREQVMAIRGAEGRHPWYAALYVQVLVGIVAGIIVGWVNPQAGEALRPIGDVFLKMIKMIIGLVIFCTVVNGLGGMSDLKKVGRVGGKALIYFEVVSTLALLVGAVVANVVDRVRDSTPIQPGWTRPPWRPMSGTLSNTVRLIS
jgi:aerobic C4-dicarboxylate transport protein